jgi:hypothetical protein
MDAMTHGDIIEHYQKLTAASDNRPSPPAVFDKRAIAKTAGEFGRSEWAIKGVLRKAGYGRGNKLTTPSS